MSRPQNSCKTLPHVESLGGDSETFGFGLEGVLSCSREKGVRAWVLKIESEWLIFRVLLYRKLSKTNEIIMNTLQIKNDLPKFNSPSSIIQKSQDIFYMFSNRVEGKV